MDPHLYRELWTSWASMLRVYSAAYGLTSTHHAVVEVSAEEILLRVDARWVRFTHEARFTSEGSESPFGLNEDGTVTLDGLTEEMDLAAEGVARSILTPKP
jgi:hypothetical protein